MADAVIVQLVLLSRDNLSHTGPFCLVDDTFLDDEPITERSFRAVWFHSNSLNDAIVRWVLDAPIVLRGFFCFILVNGRALGQNLGLDTPYSFSLYTGDVISFSHHDDAGVHIESIRYNIPAPSRVPPEGVPAHFYDGRLVTKRRRRQTSLDIALGDRAPSLEGGGWVVRETRSHGLAPTRPLRIRAYFYGDFGHLGTREYGPEISEEERHADYLQNWDIPQLRFVSMFPEVLLKPLRGTPFALNACCFHKGIFLVRLFVFLMALCLLCAVSQTFSITHKDFILFGPIPLRFLTLA